MWVVEILDHCFLFRYAKNARHFCRLAKKRKGYAACMVRLPVSGKGIL